MSVPYIPSGPLHGARATLPPTQAWKQAWGDQCFYQSYFQRPGVAEAEFERDVRTTMRRLLYGLSGDAPSSERWHPILPDPQAGALNSAGNPPPPPPWLTEAEIDIYTPQLARPGFLRGPDCDPNIDRN